MAFRHVVPEGIYDNVDDLGTDYPVRRASDLRGRAGVAALDTDWALEQEAEWYYELSTSYRRRTATVDVQMVVGEFDTGTVVDNLEKWAEDQYGDNYDDEDNEEAFESAGSEPGFELYEVEEFAFGVSEDLLIQSRGDYPVDPVAVVEEAIATHENETNLWTDDDHGGELLAEYDEGDYVFGELHRPETVEAKLERDYDEGQRDNLDDENREEIEENYEEQIEDWESGLVGTTRSRSLDGDTIELHQVFLYETEGDTDSDALLKHVEANRDYNENWDTLEDYSISEEGRALILTGDVRARAESFSDSDR